MKVHIKAITLLTLGILVINILSFGVPVFAVAAPSPGISTPFSLWPQEKQDPFRKAVEQFIYDLFGYSPTINYVDNDGSSKTATASATNSQAQAVIPDNVTGEFDEYGNLIDAEYQSLVETNRLIEACLDEYCKAVSASSYVGLGKYVDGHYISYAAFDEGINNVLNRLSSDSDVSHEIVMVNGVPQNKIETKSDIKISCLDYLNLDYTAFLTFNDLFLENYNFRGDVSGSSSSYYTFFAITSDKELYILRSYFRIPGSRSVPSYNYFALSHNYVSSSPAFSFDSTYDYRLHHAFRFFEYDGRLFPCLYFSGYSYGGSYKKVQYTYGNPALSDSFNLFSDDSEFYDGLVFSPTPAFEFKNIQLQNAYTTFLEPKTQSIISDTDLLNKKISVVGYFENNSFDTIKFDSNSFVTASNILPNYDTIYTGGNQSTTSKLTDLQKAVYILSQQYGETYEELLQKLNMFIDSAGNLIISGADGIQYSVDHLSKSFDEVIGSMEDISGDLSELLSYLKSLNIEGIEGYIAALEGTLNDLNDRDIDQSAILGGVSDILNDIKEYLNTSDLSDVKSAVLSIGDTLSSISDYFASKTEWISNITGMFTGGGVIGTDYNLYDQCKEFLKKLFNYDNIDTPPNFSFYYDSNGDGVQETYPLIDFSFLENTLTNENTVDKSLWSTPIKIIDLIRYIIAIVCYGLFVMRLIKRLPTFYGSGPLALFSK